MIVLHTALAVEARPFLDRWRMRQIESSRRGSVYRAESPEVMLVVSGTGALAAASAVSAVLAREPSIEAALSVGLAGCPLLDMACGESRFIHRIHDASSGRTYYPDVLVRHPWQEAALTTYGRMVTADDRPATLVDMESSGFFVAARAVLPPHRIALLKVISDHLEGARLDPSTAIDWISAQIDSIETFLESWTVKPEALPPLPSTLVTRIEELAEAWHLTSTQAHQLRDAVRGAFYRGRRDWALLEPTELCGSSKHARNRALKTFCDELATTV